jgi:hypothetical protein
MKGRYACCDEHRRSFLSRSDVSVNGIDGIEVLENPALPGEKSRKILIIHFFKTLRGTPLESPQYSISKAQPKEYLKVYGGEKIRNITVKSLEILPGDGCSARLELSCQGDLSVYSIAVVQGPDDPKNQQAPLKGFDPVLYSRDFRFRPECLSGECEERKICSPKPQIEPEIDYLAKDYTSFRRLMLDRMSLLKPGWKERNAADMGLALVELLAYVGDYLSYQQDAVATEAYIGTARKRISVRRHARLVDYFMHDGCNSRVFVQVMVSQDVLGTPDNPALPRHTQLITNVDEMPRRLPVGSPAADHSQAVFETVYPLLSLHLNQTEMELYTWGRDECCLSGGATSATLEGSHPELKKGDIIIFQEVLGPRSGKATDADPSHRHAVMLTKDSVLSSDPLGGLLKGSGLESVTVTDIEWGEEDALPFPLCISSLSSEEHGRRRVNRVSIALGNIVLADHGRTVRPRSNKALSGEISPVLLGKIADLKIDAGSVESLGSVPMPRLRRYPEGISSHCSIKEPEQVRPRFYPNLDRVPVTQVAILDSGSASAMIDPKSKGALASILLIQAVCDAAGKIIRCEEWSQRHNLISSGGEDMDFVVEVDDSGAAFIRFGDGRYGAAPEPGSMFYASYRVGNAIAGNVGAGTIAHIQSDDSRIIGAWNPLPAFGGTEPESVELVRMKAPMAFRSQERAVTPEDYAEIARRFPGVQNAVARFCWTGSWITVSLMVDRKSGIAVDDRFRADMIRHIDKFRMVGHDLEAADPIFVSIDLTLTVCISPEYIQDDVREALEQELSNRLLPDGRMGLFHPDNLTFGQTVYLSSIYETALKVEGVDYVQVERFQRHDRPRNAGENDSRLIFDRTEIPRLDNDPHFPERGILQLSLIGGR